MAFSHRPTWHAARGQGSTFDLRNYSTGGVASRQIAELDLPSHMKLKFRSIGQGTKAEIATRDLEQELKDKEQEHFAKSGSVPKKIEDIPRSKPVPSVSGEIEVDYEGGNEDELDQFDDKDDEVSSDSDSSSDSDDDDEAEELMKELEKIKKEKEEEKLIQEQEALLLQQKQEQGLRQSSSSGTAKVKRRWDQDVVFRNQAAKEPEVKKRFINDTIRNDFHRNFLAKYIQ